MAEKEYIERETVRNTIKAVCEKYNQAYGGNYGGFGEELAKSIDNMPTADVEPVKHGHWICENLGFGAYRYRCSECGNLYGQDQIEDFEHNKFCGDCGAKMDARTPSKERRTSMTAKEYLSRYRWLNGKIRISAELLDYNGNSITVVKGEEVSRDEGKGTS